jgi:DNA (cytosine-5)-methyltransferase 1
VNVLDSDKWATPPDLVRAIADYWNLDFVLDAAALEDSKKCEAYISPEQDTLQVPWAPYATGGAVWLNPPYSRGLIDRFMHKACFEADAGVTVVTLTRFDPSASWFQATVDAQADRVMMLPRRVKFLGAPNAYNFPLCASLFGGLCRREYFIPDRGTFTWEQ